MSRFTYWLSAIFALVGTGTALTGIAREEGKQAASGFVLILAASVFALLYLGTRRMPHAPVSSSPVDTHSP